ncbi:unnamed protein product [Hermetia illucens]|uniref:DNA repair protein RAD51 homolog 3 n=1 Tax=Hermetia illucens TaxID=343691 RepID=A0A7R8Z103_HERIL|nr:DNA repair protein RAD51 homolog 3 [Hermetia illucens]CAD7093174.1 unnamed protein product [Hermetia illucens]
MADIVGTTALDILIEETKQRPIITLCRKLDTALGGGIAPGIITEFCGPPGSGKTQFCFQLCVNVQIPRSIGGVGGKAIFIDTNQDFTPYRVKEIAEICSKRYEDVFKNSPQTSSAEPEFSVEKILDGIRYYYCNDRYELWAAIQLVKARLKEEKDIKLIVIDSICSPIRVMDDYSERIRVLYRILTDLQIMADEYNLAVVLTNNLTSKPGENNQWYLCPALGDTHTHKIGQRILLGRNPKEKDHYVAYLEKVKLSPPVYIGFKITDGGIRGAD